MIALTFPSTDSGLLVWSQSFLDLIQATPTAYGLVAADATAYSAVHTAYSNSLTACMPDVRSKAAVVAKNAARASLKDKAILLANKIYSDPAVTDAQKTELGIPPRLEPSPIPIPTASPVIEVVSVSGWTARIRLRAGEGAGRGKPAGCIGASIFSFAGEEAPGPISQWKFEGNVGRVTAVEVTFPTTLAAGSKVWFTSFYFNGRKQSGPACDPVSVNLPGGGVSMAA